MTDTRNAATSQRLRTHFGDPCIHCGISHDDVPHGNCAGDPSKAIPIAWRSLGVRWDNVECHLILMSDGEIETRYEHIDMGLADPGGYLHGVRYDPELRKRRQPWMNN